MYRNREEIESTIEDLSTRLRNIALEDDEINSDELALLDFIEKKMKNLQEQVMQILESGLGDDEFEDILTQFLDDLVHEAEEMAKLDGKISDDEQKLLDLVHEFVNKGGKLHD